MQSFNTTTKSYKKYSPMSLTIDCESARIMTKNTNTMKALLISLKNVQENIDICNKLSQAEMKLLHELFESMQTTKSNESMIKSKECTIKCNGYVFPKNITIENFKYDNENISICIDNEQYDKMFDHTKRLIFAHGFDDEFKMFNNKTLSLTDICNQKDSFVLRLVMTICVSYVQQSNTVYINYNLKNIIMTNSSPQIMMKKLAHKIDNMTKPPITTKYYSRKYNTMNNIMNILNAKAGMK